MKGFLRRPEASLAVLYGRRRCGKSRLIQETVSGLPVAYYLGDDRDGALQRKSLASAIARLLPGFDAVSYPDWDALFARWWRDAPAGSCMVLDEFPSLVATAAEIPSVLRRYADLQRAGGPHLIVAGSSQRMMQGLLLERSAPLFGRAVEVLNVRPLPAGWIGQALRLPDEAAAVEAFAVWGGVPRYWELAADFASLDEAVADLVLSPLGVLHDEPAALLLEDMREVTQAASILALIGAGCSRLSEIAGRLEKPATSLSRPLRRLVDLGLVRRETPWGSPGRDSKRTLYRIADPFLSFWFRFVEPSRSQLEMGGAAIVGRRVRADLAHHVGGVWEELVRSSVSFGRPFGLEWKPAARWWGTGLDRKPLELDLVAESADGSALLIGECKWAPAAEGALDVLSRRSSRFPAAEGRRVVFGVWAKDAPPGLRRADGLFGPADVLASLT